MPEIIPDHWIESIEGADNIDTCCAATKQGKYELHYEFVVSVNREGERWLN